MVHRDTGQIKIKIPMRFKRKSGRKEIIIPNSDDTQPATTQDSLVIAMARAHRWLDVLEDGTCGSISELAEEVGMNGSLVRRHLNLTLLRSDLVEQILDGKEPDEVSLKGLLRKVEVSWEEQTVLVL
jgi:DNA-binding transcriptional ArsR family regulator